jgi:membrane protein implicated in regulation of membrane protease activity
MTFEILYWHWWALAFAFLILEMLTPGFFFMWLAVSGLITGIIVGIFPALSVNAQTLIFSLLAVSAVTAWWIYGRRCPVKTDQPFLNKRGAHYIGRVFTVSEAIVNGRGKVKADDSLWIVEGEDCPVNTKVKVTGIKGTVLKVEKVD